MALSTAAIQEHADALNTQFNATQAAVILALVNAAKDEATGAIPAPSGIPAPPAGDGTYVLNIASGVATWVAES